MKSLYKNKQQVYCNNMSLHYITLLHYQSGSSWMLQLCLHPTVETTSQLVKLHLFRFIR